MKLKGTPARTLNPLCSGSCELHLSRLYSFCRQVECFFLHAALFKFPRGLISYYNICVHLCEGFSFTLVVNNHFPLIFLPLNWFAYKFQPENIYENVNIIAKIDFFVSEPQPASRTHLTFLCPAFEWYGHLWNFPWAGSLPPYHVPRDIWNIVVSVKIVWVWVWLVISDLS